VKGNEIRELERERKEKKRRQRRQTTTEEKSYKKDEGDDDEQQITGERSRWKKERYMKEKRTKGRK
jgi:hypothetical protein